MTTKHSYFNTNYIPTFEAKLLHIAVAMHHCYILPIGGCVYRGDQWIKFYYFPCRYKHLQLQTNDKLLPI